MRVRRRPTLRPTPSGAMVALLFVLGARTLREQPSPWLRLLVVGAALLLVLDAAWSLFAVRRLRIDLVAAPVGIVGRPLTSRLSVSGASLAVVVRMLSVRRAPEVLVHPPAQGEYVAVPDRRGVFPAATLRTLARSPLGLLAGGWVWQVHFAVPVLVGPMPVAVTVTGSGPTTAHGDGDETTRSMRPYVPGDRPGLVHWPASARAGELVVRQVEHDELAPTVVVVDLGPEAGAAAERAAAVGAGLVDSLLARGDRVTLVTSAGARTVADDLAAAAALALARPGPVTHDASTFHVSPEGVTVA